MTRTATQTNGGATEATGTNDCIEIVAPPNHERSSPLHAPLGGAATPLTSSGAIVFRVSSAAGWMASRDCLMSSSCVGRTPRVCEDLRICPCVSLRVSLCVCVCVCECVCVWRRTRVRVQREREREREREESTRILCVNAQDEDVVVLLTTRERVKVCEGVRWHFVRPRHGRV